MFVIRSALGEGPQGLTISEAKDPRPSSGEVVIQVKASAINRADLLQTLGLYPAPPGVVPDVPGLEFAGVVEEVGPDVRLVSVGEKVMGITAGGAWAERVVAHERTLIRIPHPLTFEEAAAIPEAYLTAWDALVLQGQLTVGQSVLVHAAASGVGTAALQLCSVAGAMAIGTGRTAAKLAKLKELGLSGSTVLVDGKAPSFSAEVKRLTRGGATLCLDLVGGDWLGETVASMAAHGTILLVGLVAGATAEMPLRHLMSHRLTLAGTTMRNRPLEERCANARRFETEICPLFEARRLFPVIDAVHPMSEAAAALVRLASNDTVGKLVLTW